MLRGRPHLPLKLRSSTPVLREWSSPLSQYPDLVRHTLARQYKNVKVDANRILENTREWLQPRELLYIATDEKNKSFFAPLAAAYEVKYLDDYFELAGLKKIDPNQYVVVYKRRKANQAPSLRSTHACAPNNHPNHSTHSSHPTIPDSSPWTEQGLVCVGWATQHSHRRLFR